MTRIMRLLFALALLLVPVLSQSATGCVNNLLTDAAVLNGGMPWCLNYTRLYQPNSVFSIAPKSTCEGLTPAMADASVASLGSFACALVSLRTDPTCITLATRFWCLNVYRRCQAAPAPISTIGVPTAPCYSTLASIYGYYVTSMNMTCDKVLQRAWIYAGQPAAGFSQIVPPLNATELVTCADGSPNPLGGQPKTPLQAQSFGPFPVNCSAPAPSSAVVPLMAAQCAAAAPTVLPQCMTPLEASTNIGNLFSQCLPFTQYSVYRTTFPVCSETDADGVNATELQATLRTLSSFSRLVASINRVECVNQMLEFLCHGFFRQCEPAVLQTLAGPVAIGLPRAVSRQTCLALRVPYNKKGDTCYADIYQSFLTANGASLTALVDTYGETLGTALFTKNIDATFNALFPPCNATEPACNPSTQACCSAAVSSLAGQPKYPESETVWTLSPFSAPIIVPVNSVQPPPNDEIAPVFPCYGPWGSTGGGRKGRGYCALICPRALFSKEVYEAAKYIQAFLAWPSAAATALAGATMFCQPHLRRYPGNISLWVIVCTHFLVVGFVFASLRGWESVWCVNKFESSTAYKNGSCTFQGIIFTFWATAGYLTWWFVALNTWVSVFLKKDIFSWKTEVGTHVITWGFASLVVIIGLAASVISYYDGGAFCFINIDDNGWWQYGLFYIPVGLCILTGSFFMVCVIYEMRNIRGSDKGRMYKNFRVLIFIFVFLYIWTFIFAYRFYFTDNRDAFTADFQSWAQCSISAPDCSKGQQPNPGLFIMLSVNTAATGLLTSFLFGTTKETVFFWQERFNNLRQGKSFFAGLTLTSSKAGTRVNTASAGGPE